MEANIRGLTPLSTVSGSIPRMERAWLGLAAFGLGLFAAMACVSDHDALVRRGGAGRGGNNTAPDSSAGRGGATGDAATSDANEAEAAGGETGGPDVREPRGPDRLTLFHGVVDAKRVAFCVVRQTDSGVRQAIEPLMPPSGLDYGGSLVAGVIAGVDVMTDALRIIVVAGDEALLSATSCAEALAAAEADPADASVDSDAAAAGDAAVADALRARSLPVLPATTLAQGRSFLLVATGCLGAPAHDAANREAICGSGYTTTRPTLGMVLAPMSRLTASARLGLQMLHASRATDSVGVVSLPPPESGDPALFVASDVVYGQLAPRFANTQYSKAAYGVPLEDSQLEVRRKVPGTSSVRWGEALARGGLTTADEGRNYTIVFVGPQIGARADWANAPTVTVVANDPNP